MRGLFPTKSLETALARWVVDSQTPSLFYCGQHSTQLLALSFLKFLLCVASSTPRPSPREHPPWDLLLLQLPHPGHDRSTLSPFTGQLETPSCFYASDSLMPCAQRVPPSKRTQDVPPLPLPGLPPTPSLRLRSSPHLSCSARQDPLHSPRALEDASGRCRLCREARRSFPPTSEWLGPLVQPSVPEALVSL